MERILMIDNSNSNIVTRKATLGAEINLVNNFIDSNIDDEFVEVLFSGASPTATAFNESDAFKHYLHSLKMQIQYLEKKSYKEAMDAQELLLETAERNIELNRDNGIFGQDRDFRICIDINRAALHTLNKNRGFVLAQEWKNL